MEKTISTISTLNNNFNSYDFLKDLTFKNTKESLNECIKAYKEKELSKISLDVSNKNTINVFNNELLLQAIKKALNVYIKKLNDKEEIEEIKVYNLRLKNEISSLVNEKQKPFYNALDNAIKSLSKAQYSTFKEEIKNITGLEFKDNDIKKLYTIMLGFNNGVSYRKWFIGLILQKMDKAQCISYKITNKLFKELITTLPIYTMQELIKADTLKIDEMIKNTMFKGDIKDYSKKKEYLLNKAENGGCKGFIIKPVELIKREEKESLEKQAKENEKAIEKAKEEIEKEKHRKDLLINQIKARKEELKTLQAKAHAMTILTEKEKLEKECLEKQDEIESLGKALESKKEKINNMIKQLKA